ncbi:hypothetical protein GCK72_008388 [Caenorhabditis remanei]|uniref:BPTI/Kunitz inhibitor domain-containing protein n=2 Tax=Caenorhabditis TaxID=6237 RepID=A0A6A5H0Y9_CAERE|nr:hypothetical protein GCK72_008388 [Caenorhabditis remanei]KAF1760142.1 hypothetical protein GCK72_008388 [Caenorhabditis remanei]
MKSSTSSLFILLMLTISTVFCEKCESNEECDVKWPDAICVRGRCRCPENTIRKKSPSREWVCLATNDATGNSGPPLTCPTPEGAGYQVMYRKDGEPVKCSSKKKPDTCPDGYECIQGLSILGALDGVCCPDRAKTCTHPIFDHPDDGYLSRWGFDGAQCIEFKWNPERPSSANNFKSRAHCEDYCIGSSTINGIINYQTNFHL